jgi:glutathione synthase/RimK-type ligase-like ATP-grasp enzyme
VALAKNKLKTFLTLTKAGVYTPPFTTNHAVAKAWVDAGEVVYGRKYLEASQGEGIVVITQDSGWEMCPLYTKGVMKTHEYRVHVVNGRVIDFSKKRRRSEQESNPYIKNSNNGWVFCREGVELPNAIADAAIKSVAALSLHFGAVDVAYKERDDRAYVFEVNTAPGIEGTTLTKYTEALRGYVYAPVQSRGYSHHQERIRWSR